MKKYKTKIIAAAVIIFLIAVAANITICFFGNPADRIKVRDAAEEYIALNYGEYSPKIVDIDYDFKYIGYWVEIFLEENGKTFSLQYYESGELEWDTYDFSIYEEKYGEAYYEEGIYAIRDIIGTPQNKKQKAVLAVINFDFEIQNGGLCQYLVNEDDENIVKITDYLRMVGAENQANLLEEFAVKNGLELNAVEIKSDDEYIEFEKSKPFDEFDNAYIDLENADWDEATVLTNEVISYIQDNIEDF
ncbi:MAG: DUF4375 domain-containing protein [Clostridia bacterium]|nr:DUF4375 domain-containing protein [Clostridia bacterium]